MCFRVSANTVDVVICTNEKDMSLIYLLDSPPTAEGSDCLLVACHHELLSLVADTSRREESSSYFLAVS